MLGQFLRQVRGEHSQVALGEALGCRQSNVSGIERGEQAISASMLARWLDFCGATEAERLVALRLAGEPSDPTTADPAQSEPGAA